MVFCLVQAAFFDMKTMSKKTFSIVGITATILLHFIIMTVVLTLVLLNIKYGAEADLMSTESFYLVDSIYGMVHLLYFSSLISFVVFFLSFVFISKWMKNRNA